MTLMVSHRVTIAALLIATLYVQSYFCEMFVVVIYFLSLSASVRRVQLDYNGYARFLGGFAEQRYDEREKVVIMPTTEPDYRN